jgi:hypothetical protein
LFDIERAVGLIDTWPGLIIPYMTFSLPLVICTLSAFLREIPWDLERAAKMDGATPFQAFCQVIAPLVLRTALGNIPVQDELRRAFEEQKVDREIIVGIRPEQFEDASSSPNTERLPSGGVRYTGMVDLVESAPTSTPTSCSTAPASPIQPPTTIDMGTITATQVSTNGPSPGVGRPGDSSRGANRRVSANCGSSACSRDTMRSNSADPGSYAPFLAATTSSPVLPNARCGGAMGGRATCSPAPRRAYTRSSRRRGS